MRSTQNLLFALTGGCCNGSKRTNLKRTGTRTSTRAVGTKSVPSATLREGYGGGGSGGVRKVATARLTSTGGRRGEEEHEDDNDNDADDDDDDAIPRKPLRVVPVESSTPAGRRRSGCWRATQKGRGKSEGDKSLGDPSRASSCLSTSFRQVVVWIDAFYAFEGQRESFQGKMLGGGDESCSTGDALYLVVEDRCTQHRTATRRRHRGTWDVGGAPRANKGQSSCRMDGQQDERVDAWVFRETVALPIAKAERRGRGQDQGREEVLPEDEDGHDLSLTLCSARRPAGISSSFPLRRRTPVPQGRAGAVASAEREAAPAPDEVIGSATIPLGRCLASVDRDRARKCTFSRPIRVSVVNPEGSAIGWIEVGVCGSG